MSVHSVKSKARHPDPKKAARERHEVGHITFELCDHPNDGATFALIAGMALHAKDRRPLFSGHVEKGMGAALRRLAHRFDELEGKL